MLPSGVPVVGPLARRPVEEIAGGGVFHAPDSVGIPINGGVLAPYRIPERNVQGIEFAVADGGLLAGEAPSLSVG